MHRCSYLPPSRPPAIPREEAHLAISMSDRIQSSHSVPCRRAWLCARRPASEGKRQRQRDMRIHRLMSVCGYCMFTNRWTRFECACVTIISYRMLLHFLTTQSAHTHIVTNLQHRLAAEGSPWYCCFARTSALHALVKAWSREPVTSSPILCFVPEKEKRHELQGMERRSQDAR
jgi:hypothetical protein